MDLLRADGLVGLIIADPATDQIGETGLLESMDQVRQCICLACRPSTAACDGGKELAAKLFAGCGVAKLPPKAVQESHRKPHGFVLCGAFQYVTLGFASS